MLCCNACRGPQMLTFFRGRTIGSVSRVIFSITHRFSANSSAMFAPILSFAPMVLMGWNGWFVPVPSCEFPSP